jgi:ADP-ribose pyrophosphatase YjhB (NUDIX family)
MPAGWMIDQDDPARDEIVARAQKLHVDSSPDQASHDLGTITLKDGKQVQARAVHSVDPVIVSADGEYIVLIKRRNDPGKGKLALPGGLIDPKKTGGVETAIEAAVREAGEEVNFDLSHVKGKVIGTRNMNRPDDIRVVRGDGLFKAYGLRDGDVFMVSAQPVLFVVPRLTPDMINAGDDAEAGSAQLYKISDLKRENFGIPLHFDEIMQAIGKDAAAATPKQKFRNGPSR